MDNHPFKAGQKVVCIKAPYNEEIGIQVNLRLEIGQVYTVKETRYYMDRPIVLINNMFIYAKNFAGGDTLHTVIKSGEL